MPKYRKSRVLKNKSLNSLHRSMKRISGKVIIVGKGVIGSAKRIGSNITGCVRKSIKKR
jgi:hypothetical protein